MMKDVIIKIDQNSMVYKQETVLGISYENLQGKIIFKFLGTFPKGTAYLEYERGTEKGYLQMNQVGEEYQLEIKSSLLKKEGRIYLQLRVTEDTTPEGIPVFKSNKFYLEVKEAINATAEIPDEYPKWIDVANEKIKEMDNLNITTERVEDGVDIVLTDKKGVTTRTEVKDGAPGPQGPQGEPGAVKMQVVDTLPDVGETDTIYLVKKDNPGEQNLYDEYVYANGAWEHIGDTSVDLTDYYTKEESDEKLLAKQDKLIPGNNITISDDNTINCTINENTLYIGPITTSSTMINLNDYKDALTTLINNNLDKAIYIVIKGYNDAILFGTYSFATPVTTGSSYVRFLCTYFDSSNHDSFSAKKINITYERSVDTKLYTVTDFNIMQNIPIPFAQDVLTKTNTSLYTPTADYHPATKKYVDDSINNLSSSVGSTPIYNFAYDSSLEFYSWYNNINYVTSTDTNNVNRASEIINDMYANGFGTAIINFYNKNSINASSYMCTMQFGSISNKSTSFTFMAFNKQQHIYTQNYDFENFRLDIDGTWTNEVFTANEITCQGITIGFGGGIASVDYVNNAITSAITTSLEASY